MSHKETDSSLFRHVGRAVYTIAKIIGPDESTPGNKDPQEIGRIGLWPTFFPDAMDPKKVLWGHIGSGSPFEMSHHHKWLNNNRCLISVDDEGTPQILGSIPWSTGQEKPEGYNEFEDDTTYAPSQKEVS